MNEQILAVVFLILAWHFVVGPMIFINNHAQYPQVVLGLCAITAFVLGAVVFVSGLWWAVAVIFGR